jgi:hypothetical protein
MGTSFRTGGRHAHVLRSGPVSPSPSQTTTSTGGDR